MQKKTAKKNPQSAVLGIDIEPVEPPYLVSNCHFQVRDAKHEISFLYDIVGL